MGRATRELRGLGVCREAEIYLPGATTYILNFNTTDIAHVKPKHVFEEGEAVCTYGTLEDAYGNRLGGRTIEIYANEEYVKSVTTGTGVPLEKGLWMDAPPWGEGSVLPPGSYTMKAKFLGEPGYEPSESRTVAITVKGVVPPPPIAWAPIIAIGASLVLGGGLIAASKG